MSWSASLDLPQGTWLKLPTDEVDPTQYAQDIAAALGEKATPEQRAEFAATLESMVKQARASEALFGAALLGPDDDDLVTVLFARPLLVSPGETPPTIEQLATWLAEPEPGTVGTPEVTVLDLPAGPAVRCRTRAAGDAAGDPIVESVSTIVQPAAIAPAAVMVTASWVALAMGDVLAEMVDSATATLQIHA